MPGARLDADLWINEYLSPHDIYQHGIERVIAHKKTAYQDMYIVVTGVYGKGLVLDGKWQTCTGDEFLYHEPLVHTPCAYHGDPQKVLVLGGGDGAAVREVLKWKTVTKVVMVDIDGEVVEACKEHLPEMHQGAFDDPRMELVIGNALDYLDQSDNEFDIIISDLSDPIEEGPSFKLFTQEYFQKCRRALKPDGFFVLQAGSTSPQDLTQYARINKTVGSVFEHTAGFSSYVPTYGTPWGFIMASSQPIDTRCDPEITDRLLESQTTNKFRMF
ncbi:MAG: polyamine aminopropyltransferase, partial [Planctomycetes bacterium]|nr:polyamine aminopropyltransferase [Planctomycetota bacterium]